MKIVFNDATELTVQSAEILILLFHQTVHYMLVLEPTTIM